MNLIRERTRTAAIAMLALAAGLSACKGKDQADNQTASVDTTAVRSDSAAGSTVATPPAAMAPVTDSVTPTPAPTWSDAGILGFASAANTGEIALGELGETKATSPAVKAFARRMVADHKAMMAEGNALATKIGAMRDTTAKNAQDLSSHVQDQLKDLGTMSAGADWDKNYMDKMVDDHKDVLSKLQDAAKNTTNADLRAALEKTTGKVQQHLTKAKDIVANNLKA